MPPDAPGMGGGNRAGILIPIQQRRTLRPPGVKSTSGICGTPCSLQGLFVLTPQPLNEALKAFLHFCYKKHTISFQQHVNSGLSLQQEGFAST